MPGNTSPRCRVRDAPRPSWVGGTSGQLTTNAKGNGRATFRFEIPAAEYHLQFTVRQGECDPTRGVTAGCDAVYCSGGWFAEAFESIEALRQVAKVAGRSLPPRGGQAGTEETASDRDRCRCLRGQAERR